MSLSAIHVDAESLRDRSTSLAGAENWLAPNTGAPPFLTTAKTRKKIQTTIHWKAFTRGLTAARAMPTVIAHLEPGPHSRARSPEISGANLASAEVHETLNGLQLLYGVAG
jgi:hypothetical protein